LVVAIAAFAGLTMNAAAQTTTTSSTVTVTLSFSEVDTSGFPVATPNGNLEPGEGALITMGISFTGQNTVGTFQPNIGTFGSGTIRGFGSGFFDLIGTNSQGTWLLDQGQGFGVSDDWDITGGQGNGTPDGGGGTLRNLQMGQFTATPGGINSTNPITAIWSGVWIPSSYALRLVSFATTGAVPAGTSIVSVLFRLNAGTAAGAYVTSGGLVHGSVNIPILPAPSGLALLGLAGLTAGRRRR
jgi:hypothetical protein